jgi:hypothetical protein
VCLDLPTEQSQRVAVSLDNHLTPNGTSHRIPTGEGVVLSFIPILPHGVPECARYG